jgi:hypothetical protein
MRKNLIQMSLIILMVVLTACKPYSSHTSLIYSPAQKTELIPDPLLREAWQALYGNERRVTLPDGNTIIAHALAQFVLDHSIPVVWDTENVCDGDSCSVVYCVDGLCTHEDSAPGVDPIYISLFFRALKEDQMGRLVESLAHEIYHRTQPFGQVRDSQYEEFIAIYLGAQISESTWQNFKGYDPRNPVCLVRWFNNHRLFPYLELPAYPQSMAASLAAPAPADCILEGDLVCTMTFVHPGGRPGLHDDLRRPGEVPDRWHK